MSQIALTNRGLINNEANIILQELSPEPQKEAK